MKNQPLPILRHSRSAALFGLLLSLMLSGCSLFRKEGAQMQYLIGETKPSASSPESPGLRIRPIHVSLPYAGQEFVYRTGENTYETDYYNQFFVAPGDMFTEAARNALYSGTFSPASQFRESAKSEYLLDGSVDAVYGDFRNPQQFSAVLEMRFTLFKGDGSEMLMMKRYSAEIPLAANNPDGLVKAWNAAWQQIAARLRNDLRAKTR